MSELRRELGVFSAALLVVGGIIGSGIFFTPAEVARALPSGGWIFAVWSLGGCLALAGALTYAELGAMLPDAGGPYVYIRQAFGSLPAFLYGWMALLSIASGAIAAVAMGFAGYLARFVDVAPVGGQIARGPRNRGRTDSGGEAVVYLSRLPYLPRLPCLPCRPCLPCQPVEP